MKEEVIKDLVYTALKKLYDIDGLLIDNDVNERSITHRLAFHLSCEEIFSEWDIDCEYNRISDCGTDGNCIQKKLNLWSESEPSITDSNASTVFPDIVIHHRTEVGEKNNLLVIEAKKEGKNISFDQKKIVAYIEELKYQLGVLIVFYKEKAMIMWTRDGKKWEEVTLNKLI